MQQIFLAQIESLEIENSSFFKKLEKEEFFFYYFTKNKLYYLFLYFETKFENSNKLDFILPNMVLIKELNVKRRKIRSLRGMLLYALEVIEDEKSITVLRTNLRPQLWSKVKAVIRQNKKNDLSNFLFNYVQSTDQDFNKHLSSDQEYLKLQKDLSNIQNEVSLLKEQIQILLSNNDQSNITIRSEQTKTPSFLTENSDQKFIQPSQLSPKEKEEIIKNGFIFNKEQGISLQDYYEGTEGSFTLFKLRGFSIKYQTVRQDMKYKTYKRNFDKQRII